MREVLVADEFRPCARLHREERGLSAIGARRAQEPVARQNGVKRAHEHGLDVHAGEIEIARVSAVSWPAISQKLVRHSRRGRSDLFSSRTRQLMIAPCGSGATSIRASIPFNA